LRIDDCRLKSQDTMAHAPQSAFRNPKSAMGTVRVPTERECADVPRPLGVTA